MQARPRTSGYEDLIRVIRQVRHRWRLRVALRTLALVVGLAFVTFVISAYGMDRFRYSEQAVLAFRVFAYLALAALVLRALAALPVMRGVSDEQVALYVEEHNPSLQQALVSAVEAGSDALEARRVAISPALVRRLVASTAEQCASLGDGRYIEHRRLRRASGALAALGVAGMAAILLGPAFLRHGGSLLLNPWRSARAASPYAIGVDPGNVSVARGADQLIAARLEGFDSERVEIAVKPEKADAWQRWPMTFDEDRGSFSFMFFDVRDSTQYFVEASGVRSDLFRIDVSDVPFVERIDLEYRFPDYTGLSPKRVEDGGDIAALKGTRVNLTVIPTVQVTGGRIVIEGEDPVRLARGENGTLSGAIDVKQDGFYKIELESSDGTVHKASPDYIVEVLADQPPSVTITKPGRDSKASSIEEVFTEAKAEDDYGLASLELCYSVNGGPEKTVRLLGGGGARKEVTAGHTFFLEDLNLEPGDFISYYARATDGNWVSGPQTTTTDIYFIEVRPFGKEYRQAPQAMGAGGGGADGALSLRQRQIIAATFKLVRDRSSYTEKEYGENLTTIGLMQGRLREQVENLLRRMTTRGISEQDADFAKIAESLRLAGQEMIPAEEKLVAKAPREALPPEQRALQHLQRAESVFRDVQVAFGGGGGMGGGEEASAEDLADLFDLELDKLRNQYETLERGERQSAANEVDEALQRLQELASRQQQENERMKRFNLPNQGGRGGEGERELAEQTEELARKLERLAREESIEELMDAARRLKQAASSMRRGATGGSGEGLAQGISALDELKDARRLLEKNRSARLEQDVREALSRAQALASQQERVRSEVRKLGEEGARRSERLERLLDRKDEMGEELADLEAQMDRMARGSRREQKEASRKLQEAANSIRDNKVKEKILYSKGVVQGRSPEYAEAFEEQVQADLNDLVGRIEQAARSVGRSGQSQVAGTLERTRELVRSLESLEDRVREKQSAARRLERGDRSGSQESETQSPGEPAQGAESSPKGESESPPGREGRQDQAAERDSEGDPAGRALAGAGSQDGRFLPPGRLSPQDVRQLRREFRERVKDAEALRGELVRQGLQVPDLESIIERMRAFDAKQAYLDPLGVDELQRSVVDDLKHFEYRLRRELEDLGADKLLLSRSAGVPPEFRKLVEEYYRSLSRDAREQGQRRR